MRRLLFDTNIPEDALNYVLYKLEAKNTAHRNHRALYDASSNGVVNFFRIIVNETWYQYLKDTTAYYSEVTASDMIGRFHANCSILHEANTITIQGEMINYF